MSDLSPILRFADRQPERANVPADEPRQSPFDEAERILGTATDSGGPSSRSHAA
jgi:hypothetical protein